MPDMETFKALGFLARKKAINTLSIINEAVAEIALRVDRIVAEPVSQTLAQLADVALDDIFVDVLAEQPVDEIEDLRFRDPPSPIAHEIF